MIEEKNMKARTRSTSWSCIASCGEAIVVDEATSPLPAPDLETTPAGVDVYNPAFDVTEATDIDAIITETGVIENPDIKNIAQILRIRET